jgi:DNA-binding FadR family transcriptional regulator
MFSLEYFSFLIEKVCFNKEYQQSVYDQHFKICDAIARGDAEAARLASMEHLAFIEDGLRKQVSEGENKRVRATE